MNKEEIFTKVTEILTGYLQLDPNEVKKESNVIIDLGADSLSLVEIGFLFSEAFGIPMLTPSDNNMIIGNLVDEIQKQIKA